MDKQFHLFQITTVDPYDWEQTEPRFALIDDLVDLRPDHLQAKRYCIKLAPTDNNSAHNICGTQTQLDTLYERRIYYEPLPSESDEEDAGGDSDAPPGNDWNQPNQGWGKDPDPDADNSDPSVATGGAWLSSGWGQGQSSQSAWLGHTSSWSYSNPRNWDNREQGHSSANVYDKGSAVKYAGRGHSPIPGYERVAEVELADSANRGRSGFVPPAQLQVRHVPELEVATRTTLQMVPPPPPPVYTMSIDSSSGVSGVISVPPLAAAKAPAASDTVVTPEGNGRMSDPTEENLVQPKKRPSPSRPTSAEPTIDSSMSNERELEPLVPALEETTINSQPALEKEPTPKSLTVETSDQVSTPWSPTAPNETESVSSYVQKHVTSWNTWFKPYVSDWWKTDTESVDTVDSPNIELSNNPLHEFLESQQERLDLAEEQACQAEANGNLRNDALRSQMQTRNRTGANEWLV